MTHDEDMARLRAEWDQQNEMMREWAGNLATMFKELKEKGFTEAQAMELVQTYLTEQIRGLLSSGSLQQFLEWVRRNAEDE